MASDWIKLHRAFLRWEWFQKPEMVQLFIWLLLNASYKDYRYQGRVIKRGQVVTSRRAICKEIGMPQQVIRTCFERLQETGEIEIQPTHRFSVITICNYDSYQAEILDTNPPLTHYQPTDNPLNNEKSTHQNSGLKLCGTNDYQAEILDTNPLITHSDFAESPKNDPLYKEDKKNIVVVDNARTREELVERLRSEFFASDIKQEHAAMSLRITKVQVLEVAERVFADWLATDIEPSQINMRHLLNHIAVKVEREAKSKPATDKEQWEKDLMIGAIKRRQKLK